MQLANTSVAPRDFRSTLSVGTEWGRLRLIAPVVFHVIRAQHLGVSDAEWQAAWPKTLASGPAAAKSAGKSGADFVFSVDKKFLLKTLTKEEFGQFWKVAFATPPPAHARRSFILFGRFGHFRAAVF